MNKLSKIIAATALIGSLVGCSANSSAAASSASSVNEETEKHTYTETADAESLNYVDTTFHGVTVSMPETWPGKQSLKQEQMDFAPKGSLDKVEIVYTEGATASSDFFSTLTTTEPLTVTSTDEVEVNGVKVNHAVGTIVVYDVIQMDAPCNLYAIPSENGVVTIITIQDPEGTTDMTPIYDKVLSTVTVA